MTEEFTLTLGVGSSSALHRAHVGVVASGDLELLLEPSSGSTQIHIRTTVGGHRRTWEEVMRRFFERNDYAACIEINDHGATPGLVWLRLEQALELARKEIV